MEHLTLPEQRVLFAEFSRAAYWNAADGKMFGKGKGMKAHKLFDIDGAQVHVWHNNTDLVIGARGTEPTQMNDIYADLEIFKEDSFTGVGQIHQGFRGEVDKVWEHVLARVERYGLNKKIWVKYFSNSELTFLFNNCDRLNTQVCTSLEGGKRYKF